MSGFAQEKQYVVLFKKNGERTNARDSMDYMRVVKGPNEAKLYQVTEYYKSGKLKATWMSSNIEPATGMGAYIAFWPNGNKKGSATYIQGKLNDDDSSFFYNGKLHAVITYTQSDSTLKNAPMPYLTMFIKTCNDSTGKTLVMNGEGYYKDYDDSTGVIIEEGLVKNGQRVGEWKGSSPSDKMTYKENYDSTGTLLLGTSVYPDETYTYTKRHIYAEYKGGAEALNKYLSHTMRYPAVARRNNTQGKVVLSFVINKTGGLENIKVLQSLSFETDTECIRVLKTLPAWIPGMAFGRNVQQYHTMPITFTMMGESPFTKGSLETVLMGKQDFFKTIINQVESSGKGGKAELPQQLYISFTITRTGQLSNISITADYITNKMYNAIIKEIQQSPPWEPVLKNGKPVEQRVTMPIDLRPSKK